LGKKFGGKDMEYEVKELKTKRDLIGKTIEFGYDPKTCSQIEWNILSVEGDKMLIWSKEIIEALACFE
jgi:hypothetical protein